MAAWDQHKGDADLAQRGAGEGDEHAEVGLADLDHVQAAPRPRRAAGNALPAVGEVGMVLPGGRDAKYPAETGAGGQQEGHRIGHLEDDHEIAKSRQRLSAWV